MTQPFKLEVDSDFVRNAHLTYSTETLAGDADTVVTTDGVEFLRFTVFDPEKGVYRFVYVPFGDVGAFIDKVDSLDPLQEVLNLPFPEPFDPDWVTTPPEGGLPYLDDGVDDVLPEENLDYADMVRKYGKHGPFPPPENELDLEYDGVIVVLLLDNE